MKISASAMKAAINFVKLSCQQTCFIAGQRNIEEVTCITAKSKYVGTYCTYLYAIVAECLSMRHVILRGEGCLLSSMQYVYIYIYIYLIIIHS